MTRHANTIPRIAALLAALLLGAAGAHAAGSAPATSDTAPTADGAKPAASEPAHFSAEALASLDGIWIFDTRRSDDPRKVMQASRPQGGEEGGERGGRWGGGPPGGGPPGGGPPEGGRRGGRGEMGGEMGGGPGGGQPGQAPPAGGSPMGRVMRPAQKVVIEMLADEVRVSEDERAARPYAIADSLKAHEHELVTEGTTAKWKGGTLVMTQSLGERGSLVESYALSDDGRTLTISAHREGGRSGMPNPTFRRVYTRYAGD